MKAKRRTPIHQSAALVAEAKRHAMLLAANHGAQFPALVEVVHRIDEHLDRLMELESFKKRSDFMHGKKAEK
jgi:hypothetical protein